MGGELVELAAGFSRDTPYGRFGPPPRGTGGGRRGQR